VQKITIAAVAATIILSAASALIIQFRAPASPDQRTAQEPNTDGLRRAMTFTSPKEAAK